MPSAATRLWAVDAGPSDDAIPGQALAEAWARQMRGAAKRFALSTRTGCARSRTIADFGPAGRNRQPHVAEALAYCRCIDR